ncbi:interferon alpha-inducible protein 6 isoform X2 [Myotis myotis]|uniref:Interferon alpha inducible protein 6 n=1 Tax=Myotis myotis TaxID=51298 RepID=A0A7J7ZVW0_MYOMY|nr:interferon alpha-inducible protein 6 isoform X2 [Myotis myotis]XP_036208176.1 interferon alpha-inducible protein 6 isoform X2 [Myotis myotis]KAF6378403.1 interferon alpha inducible protein 6 [Myotis myotis]
MRQKVVSLLLCYLLLYACGPVEAGKRKDSKDSDSGIWGALPYMAIGAGVLAFGLPALGFTGTGIAAHSVASWLMSCSAIANGGGVPAGGLVATLQSLGATGGGSALMANVGAAVGYAVHKQIDNKGAEEEEEE